MPALKTLLAIQLTESYNALLFYLSRLPLIGRYLPQRWYRAERFIHFSSIIAFISLLLKSFIGQLVYLFILQIVTSYLGEKLAHLSLLGLNQINREWLFLFLVSVMAWLEALLEGLFIMPDERDDTLLIKVFGLEPALYYRWSFYFNKGIGLIAASTILTLMLKVGNNSDLYQAIPLLGAVYFQVFFVGISALMRPLAWPWHRQLLTRDTDKWGMRLLLVLGGGLLVSAIIHFLWLISPMRQALFLFFQWPVALIGGVFFLLGEKGFDYYRQEINRKAKQNLSVSILLESDETSGPSEVDTADLVVEDMAVETDTEHFNQYHGMRYINEIFFARVGHRKLKLPYRKITLFLTIASAIVLALLMLFQGSIHQQLAPMEVEELFESVGPMAVLLYMYVIVMSMGETFTRICFFNMDRTMMKNHFYTQPEALRQTITYRCRRLWGYLTPIFLITVIFLGASYWLLGGRMLQPLLLPLLMVVVGIFFFGFHTLYLYYLVQPYTENMKIKSPLYSLLHYMGYAVVILASHLMGTLSPLTAWLTLSSILGIYVIIGYFLVIHFAPSRFKLR
ncbi:MAG: hypothetical protein Q4A67_01870 [Aerococcus sp.]|nr:hypothetical protein [Aerococcus sp.]